MSPKQPGVKRHQRGLHGKGQGKAGGQRDVRDRQPRIVELAAANPSWTELDLTWAIVEEMAAPLIREFYAGRERAGD